MAGPAAAAPPPLAFVKPEKLLVTCAQLAKGEGLGIEIHNETATRQDVNLRPRGFGETPAEAAKVCGGLEIKVAGSLDGGAGTTARLSAPRSTGSKASGSLTLFAKRGRVASLELEIGPAEETLQATPLVASRTVKVEGGDRGPIWIPVKGQEKDLPDPAHSSATPPLTVGAVAGPDGPVPVTYSERKELDDETAAVGLELAGDLDPGTYSGLVDLNPEDEEKGVVPLELKVAACWLLAAGLIALGIFVGWLLLRWAGRGMPRARFLKRIEDLRERHTKAAVALKEVVAGGQDWDGFEIKNLQGLEAKLRERLEQATEHVVVQVDKAVLDAMEAAVVVVETQIDLLREIPEHALDLERELEKLERERPALLPDLKGDDRGQARPSLVAEARKALVGTGVDADELKPRIEEIDALAKQVRTLRQLEGRLGHLWDARQDLAGLEKTKLDVLDTKLDAIRHLLWTAESGEDLTTAAGEIQDLAKKIAELWHQLPAPLPGLARVSKSLYSSGLLLDVEGDLGGVIEILSGEPSPAPAASLPAAPADPQLSEDSARQEIHRARMYQRMVVALAAALALATGLSFLYAGNDTWGSWWDYLAAVTWGLGVQAAVSTLATSLDGLGALTQRLPLGTGAAKGP